MKKWCSVLCLFLLSISVACSSNAPPTLLSATEIPTTIPTGADFSTETASALAPTIAPTRLPVTQTTAPTPTQTASPAATLPPPTIEPTATQSATKIPATPTLTATRAPSPTGTMAVPAAPGGDAANGEILFVKVGCKGCHIPPPNSKRIAPDLRNILADADEYIHLAEYQGTATDAPSYIRESIVLPNIFVVPAYRYLTRDGSSIMPLDFAERLSVAEIKDVVAYVLTLP